MKFTLQVHSNGCISVCFKVFVEICHFADALFERGGVRLLSNHAKVIQKQWADPTTHEYLNMEWDTQ